MTSLAAVFDVLLAATLVGLAFRLLHHPDRFTSLVLFVAYGLLMGIAWTRLGAPDIALAEAAIGAGLTGALLFDAHARFEPPPGAPVRTSGTWWNATAIALVALLAAALATTFPPLAAQHGRLGGDALAALEKAGHAQPTTGVLLDLRSWDTLLELGVLFLALAGVLALGVGRPATRPPPDLPLAWVTRRLVPLILIAGGYLLWLGTRAPGGAFQSGAVLAAAGVMLRLSGASAGLPPTSRALRSAALAGFVVFLLAGTGLLLAGDGLLVYPEGRTRAFVLGIELVAAGSIGVTLIALFAASAPPEGKEESP